MRSHDILSINLNHKKFLISFMLSFKPYGFLFVSQFKWKPSFILYDDDYETIGSQFGGFDEIGEPPPVHIIYPRPSFNQACNLQLFLSSNFNQTLNSFLIASIVKIFQMFLL